nr:hypothetical protein [Sphingopyxis lindanitolerans]
MRRDIVPAFAQVSPERPVGETRIDMSRVGRLIGRRHYAEAGAKSARLEEVGGLFRGRKETVVEAETDGFLCHTSAS